MDIVSCKTCCLITRTPADGSSKALLGNGLDMGTTRPNVLKERPSPTSDTRRDHACVRMVVSQP